MEVILLNCWNWLKKFFIKKENLQAQQNNRHTYSFSTMADSKFNMPNINAKNSTVIINTYHQDGVTPTSRENKPVEDLFINLNTKASASDSINTDIPLCDLLSERELQVMTMIVKGQNTEKISKKLCVSQKVVNSYRYRIYEKLNIQSDAELHSLAKELGAKS